MELMALILIWPLLILFLGVIFISLNDISGIAAFWVALFFIIALYIIKDHLADSSSKQKNIVEQLEEARRTIITLSIALIMPLFVHALIKTADNSLPVVLAGIVVSFVAIIGGLFISNNKVITYSSIIGGAFSLVYGYSQIWNLGDVARIIAAGSGLLLAVIIAGIKLKDKIS